MGGMELVLEVGLARQVSTLPRRSTLLFFSWASDLLSAGPLSSIQPNGLNSSPVAFSQRGLSLVHME